MPAIWSSSERPMSVRTVWVDGVRHAILSSDDPAGISYPRVRRHSAKSTSTKKTYPRLNLRCRVDSFEDRRTSESLDSCFVNLQVVVNEPAERATERRIARRQSAPSYCNRRGTVQSNSRNFIEFRLDEVLNYSEDRTCRASRQSSRKRETDSGPGRTDYSQNNLISSEIKTSKKSLFECDRHCRRYSEEITQTPETPSNLLSERVLQWMDLSGRTVNVPSDEDKLGDVKINSSKPKFSKRDCNEMATKEQVVVQNYKIQTENKLEELSTRRTRSKGPSSKDRSDKSTVNTCAKIQETNVNDDCDDTKIPSKIENRKTSTRSKEPALIARPQLHIFMPDLNSSGDDTSSEESSSKN
ncbi:uncharacterized protein [Venturia canescens]|uniref:uncharacterized protein n=1 Tax=Venturia canescens TaxID=32260 RepID=UPI001C9C5A31|nr:uncharacterized protein LOC122412814 [Venturia canescens]XP_043278625.1 uncharacterized protein LOC122412814 [Venturia canescens]